MTAYRSALPQLSEVFLTDGGIETTLIFDDGFDLPDFAAFVLVDDEHGRDALVQYFEAYLAIAVRDRVGIVLETPTWRASHDWGARQGYSTDRLAAVNRSAVEMLHSLRALWERPKTPVVISGCIGPRGDGYEVTTQMTPSDAQDYHTAQIQTFADARVDLVTGITMTSPAEASGLVWAAFEASVPAVISFTVETDGRLPSGHSLAEAILETDEATNDYPAYYMVNCAHPTHFTSGLDPDDPSTRRLGGIRANASRMSHEELDAATQLDAGDPQELADLYRALRETHPQFRVLGGCCGTSHHHIDAISAACNAKGRS